MQSWNATFFLFFFVIRCGGGGISGRVRALNLTVPLGSGRVGSDDLGYGPGSGFSFEPVQTSKWDTADPSLKFEIKFDSQDCPINNWKNFRTTFTFSHLADAFIQSDLQLGTTTTGAMLTPGHRV